MEGLMLEILIALCGTGASLYETAVFFFGVGVITFAGFLILAIKNFDQ